MKNKLLLCPFCGNEPTKPLIFNAFDIDTKVEGGSTWWEIQCRGQSCRITQAHKTKDGVIELWNQRYND